MSALIDSLQAGFAAQDAKEAGLQSIGDLRRTAMLHARALELPGQRSERWKYTSLRALAARTFSTVSGDTPRLHPAALLDIPAPRVVFVNGQLDTSLSDFGTEIEGLSMVSLKAALAKGDPDAVDALIADFNAPDAAFAWLNTALASDGILLRVADGVNVALPVQWVFVGAPAPQDVASHCRNAVHVGAGARLTLVEHYIGTGEHRHLGNHLTRVSLGAAAAMSHARLQDEDGGASIVARTDVQVATQGHYQRIDLELGAALSRHELNVRLEGFGARVDSRGAMLAGGRRHVDSQLVIDHAAGDTICDLFWRGLAADRGRIAFHGGITIHAGADGSDARLSNKNLLLSDRAEIDTQPVLQIHTDEVKAAHGATIGRLDSLALFYLRSRGIDEAQARLLLTLAFCREALASVTDTALVELLSPRLEARLASLEVPA